MSENGAARKPPGFLTALPFYYGWFIVALSFLGNLTMAGIRSAPSVLIHPLEAEFGWSRTAISSAASLNLLLLGLFAPVGGGAWVRMHFGDYQFAFLVGGCLGLVAACLALTVNRGQAAQPQIQGAELAGA